jgi:hypothetical protein
VGCIYGSGNTTVLDNGQLTAASIVQDTLTIGGSLSMACAGNTASVPEPSVLILLVSGSFSLLAFAWRRWKMTA